MIANDFNIKLLIDAKKDLYSWATNDLTFQLAREVMSIGFAKIKIFYESLGLDPNNVIIVFGPDGSITRNKKRFNKGVGYGCVVATKEYIFPSLLQPNGCGYGLYAIKEFSSIRDLIRKLNILKSEGIPIGEKKGLWDVWKSNHFIDILKLDKIYPNYSYFENWLTNDVFVLIHSSQQIETKKLSEWHPEEFIKVETPFGEVKALVDESCDRYLEYFRKVEQYSKDKRNSIANELFGHDNVICISNSTHQGYFKENEYNVMRLGLYNSLNRSGEKNLPLFPIGFNAYSFIYLYEGINNIKESHWTESQMRSAKENNHTSFLKKINILPHGGGYKLIYPYSTAKTVIYDDNIFFDLHDTHMNNHLLIQDIESLEYGYRGPDEILSLVDRFEMGNKVARFLPTRVIKF